MSIRKIPEIFGSMVFNESVMKEGLPKDTYKALKRTREQGEPLDPQVAGCFQFSLRRPACNL